MHDPILYYGFMQLIVTDVISLEDLKLILSSVATVCMGAYVVLKLG